MADHNYESQEPNPTTEPLSEQTNTPSLKTATSRTFSPSPAAQRLAVEAEVARLEIVKKNQMRKPTPKQFSDSLQEQFARVEPVLVATPGKQQAVSDAEHDRRVHQLLDESGVPQIYRSIDLADLSLIPAADRDAYAAAANAIRSGISKPGSIVAVLGGRGPGKTAIVCGLVLEFCRVGKKAIYCEMLDLFEEIKRAYNAGGDALKVEQKYVRPSLVAFDQIEERGDTAWEDRMFTRIINKRYGAEISSLLVANFTKKQFVARIGESINDRIRDGGGYVECTWKSLRGRIKREDKSCH